MRANARKAQAGEGLSLETLTKIIIGVLFAIFLFAATRSAYNDDSIHHIHATKSAGLTIDALSAIQGNAILPQRYARNESFSMRGSTLYVSQQPYDELYRKYTSVSIPKSHTLTIENNKTAQWYFSKQANAISVTTTPTQIQDVQQCLKRTTLQKTYIITDSDAAQEILGTTTQPIVFAHRYIDEDVSLQLSINQQLPPGKVRIYAATQVLDIGCPLKNAFTMQTMHATLIPLDYRGRGKKLIEIQAEKETLESIRFATAILEGVKPHYQ